MDVWDTWDSTKLFHTQDLKVHHVMLAFMTFFMIFKPKILIDIQFSQLFEFTQIQRITFHCSQSF